MPLRLLDEVKSDLHFAVRSLRRRPGFGLVAVACLAIGISVNTTTFSLIDALLFRDFPGVVDQQRIATVLLGRDTPGYRTSPGAAALPDWGEFESGLPAFSAVAAYGIAPVSARAVGDPEVVRADFVSPGFFALLGTQPAAGRLFSVADAGDPRQVVLSWGYWDRVFQRRPDIVGQGLTIGTQGFTVIGVAPRGFVGLIPAGILDPDVSTPSLYLPLTAAMLVRAGPAKTDLPALLDDDWLSIVGRLRPGATAEQAEAQAAIVAARLSAGHPAERSGTYAKVRAGGGAVADPADTAVGVLFVMAVPVIILLVACANLANQLLSRAVERSGEIAVRMSLGASRGRVVRQLLVEAGALAVAASALGLLIARWILDALGAVLPLPFRISFDGRVLCFSLALAVATAILFGLMPALRATGVSLAEVMKDRAPGGGPRGNRLLGALVVAQIAASLALLTVASVFLRAAGPRVGADPEGAGSRTTVVALDLDLLNLTAAAGRVFQADLLERMRALSGVSAAAIASFSPFQEPDPRRIRDITRGGGREDFYDVALVSGDWFGVSAERVLTGRALTPAELAGGAPQVVAVVDAVFARGMWGDSLAVGRVLRVGEGATAGVVTVVGVVDTIRTSPFRQSDGRLVMPRSAGYDPRTYLYVRTAGPARARQADVVAAVRALDPRMPVLWVRTRDDLTELEIAPIALAAQGLRAMGAVALGLAALGLFGVMSFVVSSRRHEIAVRVALGARRLDVTGLVLRQALRLGAVGVVLGSVVATAATLGIRSVIHGVPALDPVALAASAALMLLVAVTATVIPARQAAQVDPNTTLRNE